MEIEILRKSSGAPGVSDSSLAPGSGGGSETRSATSSKAELMEKMRPIVTEILKDELLRMKRKVGAP